MSHPWLLLLLAIAAEVVGTSCLKLSEGMSRPLPTLVGVLAYRQIPTGGQLLGMALITAGVVLVNLNGGAQGGAHG